MDPLDRLWLASRLLEERDEPELAGRLLRGEELSLRGLLEQPAPGGSEQEREQLGSFLTSCLISSGVLTTRSERQPGGLLPLAPGDPGRIGQYVLEAEIGRGGMGVVYRARQDGLSRIVALKLLDGGATDPTRQARFLREARLAGSLRHPGIVAVYEVGQDGGRLFIAMEYVPGASLQQLLEWGALPRRRAGALLLDVARAVAYAHEQGVIHRDIKPSNILVDGSWRPSLVDFGLARAIDDSSPLTRSGDLLGTPHYIAPEQLAGRPGAVGPASDVWALGVVLYQVLTRQRPFEADTSAALFHQVLEADPRPPRRLQPDLSPALEAVTLRALEKNPARRYPDGAALAEDLERALSGEPVSARLPGARRRLLRALARRRPAVVLAFGLACAAVGFAVPLGRDPLPARLPAAQAAAPLALPDLPAAARALLDRGRAARFDGLRLQDLGRAEAAAQAFERARSALDRACVVAPGSAGVWYERALLALDLGLRSQAVEALDRALRLDPAHLLSRFERARIAVRRLFERRAGQLDALRWRDDPVRRRLEPLVRAELARLEQAAGALDPWRVAYVAGALAAATGRLDQARKLLDQSLDAQQLDPALHLLSAWVHMQQRRPDRALAELDRALVLRPGLAVLHFNRGRALQRLLRHAEAEAAYTRAIALRGAYPAALVQRGMLRWRALGRVEAARADLDAALAQDPAHLPALVNRGLLRTETGDPAGGIADQTRVLDQAPGLAVALFNRAVARYQAGDPRQAALDYTALLARIPGDAQARYNRARCYLDLGQTARAAAEYRRAARESAPRFIEPLLQLGVMAIAAGQPVEARRWFSLAIERAPQDPEGWRHRAKLAVELEQPQPALADLERLFALTPPARRPAADHDLRGMARYQATRFAEALADFQEAARRAPREARYPHRCAAALLELGREREAMVALDRALQLDPAYSEALLQRALLRYKLKAPGALDDLQLLRRREPDHLLALYWSARLLSEQGQPDQAARLVKRFLETAPTDHPLRGAARRLLGRR